LRAAGDFFAGALVTVAIFLDFWREKGAFTDPASSCNLPPCRKAEAAAPMLHAAAARASAVELVGGQCYCCACGTYSNGIGCCYDDHGNQLSNSPPSPELSSGDGGEFGELLLLPRPRAARLLEKIGASLTEESAHFGFGPTQIFFPWENQKDAHLKMKHDGAL